MHRTYYFCNPTAQKRPRLGLAHHSRFLIFTSLILLLVAYVRATFGKYIPQKVLLVTEKPYILQFRLSTSLQNPLPAFQKCSVSNEKCPPRPPRQFLLLTSPVKTRQGFDFAALHFQICLVDVTNRFSSDFDKIPTDSCSVSNENQCFLSKYHNWGPQMTPVSWCHHASYVYRLGHWHVGRRRPSCAVYTIMAHFGPESCCRLRKTEFYRICWLSPVSSHSLFQGFRRFSFLAFQNPPPSAGKVYFTLFSRVPKKRMCLRLKENYSFLIIYSQLCFLVFSIFQNP